MFLGCIPQVDLAVGSGTPVSSCAALPQLQAGLERLHRDLEIGTSAREALGSPTQMPQVARLRMEMREVGGCGAPQGRCQPQPRLSSRGNAVPVWPASIFPRETRNPYFYVICKSWQLIRIFLKTSEQTKQNILLPSLQPLGTVHSLLLQTGTEA